MLYETAIMNFSKLTKFLHFFDNKVGTEREVSNTDLNQYYVVCFELTPSDMNKTRKWFLRNRGGG